MDVAVSVIIPIYNLEKYINKCIQSIVNQTYKNIEIILVDDGSKDKSPILCEQWAAKDSRIHVYHNVNSGVSAARNFGIKKAEGTWIMFVDGDDWIEVDAVETLIKKTTEAHMDVVIGSHVWDINGKSIQASTIKKTESYLDTEKIKYQLQAACFIRPSDTNHLFCDELQNFPMLSVSIAKLYRKELLDKNQILFPVELVIGEDIIFNFRVQKYAVTIGFINHPVYHYVIRKGSATNNMFDKKKKLQDFLKLLNSEIRKETESDILDTCYLIKVLSETEELCQYYGMSVKGGKQFYEAVKSIQDFYEKCINLGRDKTIHIKYVKATRERVMFFLIKNHRINIALLICCIYYRVFSTKNRCEM